MPDYQLATRRAARKFGVDEGILLRLIKQESGFNPHAHSPAGAQGIAQFMPGTAPAYGVNLHDNRVTDDLEGAARYIAANLKRTGGSYAQALSIYNSGSPTGYQRIAETRNYVRSILDGQTPRQSQGSGPSGGGGQRVSGSVTPGSTSGAGFDPGQDAPLLAGLLAQPERVPVATPVPVAPHARGPVVQGPAPLVAQGGVEGLLQAIRTPAQEIPDATTSAGSTRVTTSGQPRASASRVSGSGTVRVSPTANRAGADLTPGILKLVRAVSARAGRPITIGTGTKHDRLTVDGNVSDHYEGNAADLPTTPGHDNITLGRQALVALGMPRAQAEKAGGGIYNLPYGQHRRIQVIFNTNAGGNHHDHVHVGVTSLKRR